MTYELFKPDVAGENLIKAITKIVNQFKDELTIPAHLNVANVTNLYKKKVTRHFLIHIVEYLEYQY